MSITLLQALSKTKTILYPPHGKPVDKTVADELKQRLSPNASIKESDDEDHRLPTDGVFRIAIADEWMPDELSIMAPKDKDWMYAYVTDTGTGALITSRANFLYSLLCHLEEEWVQEDVEKFSKGKLITTTFRMQRPLYDVFLTQGWRIARKFNREKHIRELARCGYTHVEVNGLGTPTPLETGPKDEVYPRFYTYCPALDQFVESRLNRGTYPADYLQANLNYLKRNAELATRYGLTPGLLCFEPRSVPESLLERYPTLRGARVDHPFRSFKPRFNLSIAHPVVREHYAELMRNLMKKVPELGYIVIWTNDSGAGFEYTKSLYVGRNGGAYLIREWKSDEEIAQAAGNNVIRFLRLLRDAASEINPEFRVITRMESFYGEHDIVWKGLGDRVDVEATTLLSKGWDVPYKHPRYDDVTEVGGTPFQNTFYEKEMEPVNDLESRGGHVHVIHAHGPVNFFEPLLGIPYPWLAYDKLKAMSSLGVQYIAQMGGTVPPSLASYCVNQEVWRAFQFDSTLDIDRTVHEIASRWVGGELAGKLVDVWRLTEEAIRAYPIPVMLYSVYGFIWFRLWVRPLVPNIEAIPEAEREYYEKFTLSTPHNLNRVDLMRDVLFDLTTPQRCLDAIKRMDDHLWSPLNQAIELLTSTIASLPSDSKAREVFYDQRERLRALRCWFRTQRSVAAWIAGVHGYLEAKDDGTRRACQELLREMMQQEIENTRDLLELWETTTVEFMAVSAIGETTLIYGENFGDLLRKKIEIMQGRENDEPYIDPNFMWRVPGFTEQLAK